MNFWRRARRYLRDLFLLHLIQGTLCHLYGRHRDLGYVAEIARKGFRGAPMYQCRKCLQFFITDSDATKLGGKPTVVKLPAKSAR